MKHIPYDVLKGRRESANSARKTARYWRARAFDNATGFKTYHTGDTVPIVTEENRDIVAYYMRTADSAADEARRYYRQARRAPAILKRIDQYRETGRRLRLVDQRAATITRHIGIPRFSVLQESLLNALQDIKAGQWAEKDIPRGFEIPRCVRIETDQANAAVVLSLNGETTRIGAKVDRPGKVAIRYSDLLEMVRLLPKERIDFDRQRSSARVYTQASVITMKCVRSTTTFAIDVTADELPPPQEAAAPIALFSVTPAGKKRLSELLNHVGKAGRHTEAFGIRLTTTEKHIRFECSDGITYAATSIPADVLIPNDIQFFDPAQFKTWIGRLKPTAKHAAPVTLTAGGFTAGNLVTNLAAGRQWSFTPGAAFTGTRGKLRAYLADFGKLPAKSASRLTLHECATPPISEHFEIGPEVRTLTIRAFEFAEGDEPYWQKQIDAEGHWRGGIELPARAIADLARLAKLDLDLVWFHLVTGGGRLALAVVTGDFQYVAIGREIGAADPAPEPATAAAG